MGWFADTKETLSSKLKERQGKSAHDKSAQGKSAQGKSKQGKSKQGKSTQGKSTQGKSTQGSSHGQPAHRQLAQGSSYGQPTHGQPTHGQPTHVHSAQEELSAQDQATIDAMKAEIKRNYDSLQDVQIAYHKGLHDIALPNKKAVVRYSGSPEVIFAKECVEIAIMINFWLYRSLHPPDGGLHDTSTREEKKSLAHTEFTKYAKECRGELTKTAHKIKGLIDSRHTTMYEHQAEHEKLDGKVKFFHRHMKSSTTMPLTAELAKYNKQIHSGWHVAGATADDSSASTAQRRSPPDAPDTISEFLRMWKAEWVDTSERWKCQIPAREDVAGEVEKVEKTIIETSLAVYEHGHHSDESRGVLGYKRDYNRSLWRHYGAGPSGEPDFRGMPWSAHVLTPAMVRWHIEHQEQGVLRSVPETPPYGRDSSIESRSRVYQTRPDSR